MAKDLIGNIYGNWKVIAFDYENYNKRKQEGKCRDDKWICECQCEARTIKSILERSLKNNLSVSCFECKEYSQFQDLTGKKSGKLTALKYHKNYFDNKAGAWECKCDCGNKVHKFIRTGDFNRGTSCHCGCMDYEDLTGQKFDKLTVISRNYDKKWNGNIMWNCICECNPEIISVVTSSGHLKNGHTTSCGCNKGSERKLNEYIFYDDYIIIKASNTNNEFKISNEDYIKVKDYTWYEGQNGYLYTSLLDQQKDKVLIHRFIMDVIDKNDAIIDHKNGDITNNMRENLRIVSQMQNTWNSLISKNNKTGVKGVFKTRNNKYQARITCKGMIHNLGTYETLEEAKRVRENAELKLFGEFSVLNREGVIND